MAYFVNRNHILTFGTNSKKYLKLHPPDCCLYSEDGSKFKIHKELLGQTAFLRKILDSTKSCCCVAIQILCPCSEKELGLLVKFLYTGKIICDEVDDLDKTIDNLKEIFGFPNELPLWPEENNDFIIKEEPCDQEENVDDDQGENGIDTNSQEPKDDLPVVHLKCSNGKNNPEIISTNDFVDDVTNHEQESIAQAVVDDIENSTQIDDDKNSEKPQAKKSLRSRFLCEYCKKSFTVKNNLIRHIKYAHQNLKPHKCIECEKAFSLKQGLQRHVTKIHLKEIEEKKAEVADVEDLDPFSKDDEDQFKALLFEEKSSENMVILINNLSFTSS